MASVHISYGKNITWELSLYKPERSRFHVNLYPTASRFDMKSLVLFIHALGQCTFAYHLEGQCRGIPGSVQTCASAYWQDEDVKGFTCDGVAVSSKTLPNNNDPASVVVGPPAQATNRSSNVSKVTVIQTPPQGPRTATINSITAIVGPPIKATVRASGGLSSLTSTNHGNIRMSLGKEM